MQSKQHHLTNSLYMRWIHLYLNLALDLTQSTNFIHSSLTYAEMEVLCC